MIIVRQGSSLVATTDKRRFSQKHFVFDLDETLGSFRELHELWTPDPQVSRLTSLLRLFPEFLRVGIVPILQFLQEKKQQGFFGHLYLYTNNQCGRFWAESLVKAIEEVAATPGLFDHIICAFKINNVVVESKRTSQQKTWSDFMRCTLLPSTAQICFIDDTYFPKMAKDRVFYLQPRPYHHTLSKTEIAKRLFAADKPTTTTTTTSATEERIMAARLMTFLSDFFNLGLRKPSTRKIKGRFWYHLTQKRRHRGLA
jgi:hypothetical protein